MRVLSVSPFHDSSAAIINDGVVEYFCKEERLTRKKRDGSPFASVLEAIKNAKGKIDIAVICSPTKKDIFNTFLETYIGKFTDAKIIRFCDHHHLAHASNAFYNSGFTKSLVVVIDRSGACFNNMREAESVFIAEYPNEFKPIYKSYWAWDIGSSFDPDNHDTIAETTEGWRDCEIVIGSTCNITKVYESATTLIGQFPLENGKTMGLAAYGKDKPFKNFFVDGLPNSNLFYHFVDGQACPVVYAQYHKKCLPLGAPVPKDDYEFFADYAYQVQKQTQQAVLELVKRKVEETGIKNVCLSGGYALNVVANEFLIKNLPNVKFYFEPIPDDAGNSIGSAMYVYRNETKDITIRKLDNIFFNHINHDYNVEGGISVTTADIAKFISEGKTVAVYNGQAEAGPRALGNRSILFDSRNKDAKRIVNTVKNREWYRPFAGSVLKDDARNYFDMHHITESPFMTVSFQVKDDKKSVIPGIVHVDGSCRIQTVDESIPHFYEVLTEFKKITNVSVVLNTSFNMAGEALVETPEQAVTTFEKTNIDVLWFPEKQLMLKKI
jgi:carbamoyltransferase